MFWSYTLRQGRMAKEKVDLGPKTEETQGPGGRGGKDEHQKG